MPNTVGAAYADAANSFFNLGSAIICNGSWMVGSFGEEGAENWGEGFNPSTIHGAVLPGNVAIANPIGYGWWIPSTVSDDEAELALAFLELMLQPEELEFSMLTLGGHIPGFNYTAEFLQKRSENKLLDEYINAVDADAKIVPAFADAILPSIADPEFGKLLPKLIDGSFTPTEFAAELTKKSAETAS